MANEGIEAGAVRPSAPGRITLQGRTFGNLANAPSIGELVGARPSTGSPQSVELTVPRDSTAQRTTGERKRAS